MNEHTTEPCAIVELRQYTHHPGRRDDLIELFEREFIETQEAVGMMVIGQFRDLDDANRFVWLRGFTDMESRKKALGAFYGGPVWKAHREAANATLVDNDNVLLLHPAQPGSGFAPHAGEGGPIVALVYPTGAASPQAFASLFEDAVEPALVDAGSTVLATFVTEHSENTFPTLPVREGENVFVSFASFVDRAAVERYRATLADANPQPSEVLLLAPTARSRVR